MSTKPRLPQLWNQPRPVPTYPRAKPFAETSRAAHQSLGEHSTSVEQRVLEAIRAAGAYGITRQEIARRLDLAINVVCGRVDNLLPKKRRVAFEPFRSGALPDIQRDRQSKGSYVQREGRKIVVAWEYLADYPDTAAFYRRKVA